MLFLCLLCCSQLHNQVICSLRSLFCDIFVCIEARSPSHEPSRDYPSLDGAREREANPGWMHSLCVRFAFVFLNFFALRCFAEEMPPRPASSNLDIFVLFLLLLCAENKY